MSAAMRRRGRRGRTTASSIFGGEEMSVGKVGEYSQDDGYPDDHIGSRKINELGDLLMAEPGVGSGQARCG
jgi:hypothetical protein